jgi:Heterokaryon incompatibility protein (HET)
MEYIFKPGAQPCKTDPSSEASFCLVKGWLETCNLQHQCYQGTGVKLPTRLIDVSKEQPYLLDSSNLKGPYIALSHCWGKIQPITTTTSTISTRIEGIPIETLPKLFQDAVHITRRLNINYLWIDSLCIIQDSAEDWAREAAQMGNIYRHAFLTIFALDSEDCHQGILVQRSSGDQSGAGSLQDDENSNAALSRTLPDRYKRDILKASPLCKRGWVLQERFLSPRILYYSTEEMFWECLGCTARESQKGVRVYQPATYFHQRNDCVDVKNRLIRPPGPNPSLTLSPLTDWHIIAVEYTRNHLKKRTDKLPALSGLASIFSANTGYTYLAGLWKEDFRDGLLWYVDPTKYDETRQSELA